MQVLKEEIREAIIEKAKTEFLKHGFEKASVRKIAKEAGTTIGNFYNYFNSKEEIFYVITTPAFESFKNFIKKHNEEDFLKEYEGVAVSEALARQVMAEIIKRYNEIFDEAMLILIDGSKGTKYENVKEEIITFLSEHFIEHMDSIPHKGRNEFHSYLPHVVASGFLEGLLDIMRSNCTVEEKEKLFADYILLYLFGLGSLNFPFIKE